MKGNDNKPTFVWQGVLVLAPVLLLVLLCSLFIWRDYTRADEEGRRRALEIVDQISAALPRAMAQQMTEFDARSDGWTHYQRHVLSAWPSSQRATNAAPAWATNVNVRYQNTGDRARIMNDEPRRAAGANHADRIWYEARSNEFQAWIVARQWNDIMPNVVLLTTNDTLLLPPSYSATPDPAPFDNVPAHLQQPLSVLHSALLGNAAPDSARAACDALLASNSPARLRAFARYARAMLDGSPQQLAKASRDFSGARSEAGLPLSSLALAAALRRGTNIDELLFEAVRVETLQSPSLFTTRFLDELRRRAAPQDDPAVAHAVAALRQSWDADERLRRFAQATRRQHPDWHPSVATNFWIDSSDQWLAVITPSWQVQQRRTDAVTNLVAQARFYSRPVLARALSLAILNDARITVPRYLALHLDLAGQEAAVFRGSKEQRGAPPLRELASAIGFLDLPGTLPQSHDAQFSSARPAFRIRAFLADPAMLHSAQRQRSFLLSFVIVTSAIAAVVGLLAAKRAFEHQRHLAEMKSNFVSSVSHELRAPIASVRLMAEGLERGRVADPEQRQRYYRFIVQECRRLSAMIENVLDFARIEQGRKRYEIEPADLRALVEQTVELLQPYANERGVTLRAELCELVWDVDASAIQQALVNLIDNAIKHSPAGADVLVRLEATAESASMSVSDRGPGIPAAEHGRIFERFYRLGSELRRETQGVGIGLSIVKHIVEGHGGRVCVRSSEGAGSTFTIEVPQAASTTHNAEAVAIHPSYGDK